METIKAQGSTFGQFMADVERLREAIDDEEIFFVRRSSGLFRPGAHGYTSNVEEAGIFPGAVAKRFLDAEGVELISGREMALELARERHEAADRIREMLEGYGVDTGATVLNFPN